MAKLLGDAASFAAQQVPAEASVDVSDAPKTVARTYAGVSVLSALASTACARMTM
jgi:hypothetical protein